MPTTAAPIVCWNLPIYGGSPDGRGKTTCAYFLPDGRYIFSSTHHHGDAPPPPADRSKGYIWPLYRTFDIFLAYPDMGALQPLTWSDGYDAEATVSGDGARIVFTSHREGGIGLWTMNVDGSDLRKVNHRRGYAGGAFFSPDGQWLVYRAFYPSSDKEEQAWKRMLDEAALVPVPMEIYVARPDGSDERAITRTGKVNFAPIFHPDGRRILFTSDVDAKHRGQYGLWLVNADASGLERVTFHEGTAEAGGFDGFPCFSPDGRMVAWISNRGGRDRRDLNVFVAGWRE
jgi:Tol biopolymer transport system component